MRATKYSGHFQFTSSVLLAVVVQFFLYLSVLFVQSDPIRMLDLNNWELFGLAVDVCVVYLLNRFYKNQVKDADLIVVSLSPQTTT